MYSFLLKKLLLSTFLCVNYSLLIIVVFIWITFSEKNGLAPYWLVPILHPYTRAYQEK